MAEGRKIRDSLNKTTPGEIPSPPLRLQQQLYKPGWGQGGTEGGGRDKASGFWAKGRARWGRNPREGVPAPLPGGTSQGKMGQAVATPGQERAPRGLGLRREPLLPSVCSPTAVPRPYGESSPPHLSSALSPPLPSSSPSSLVLHRPLTPPRGWLPVQVPLLWVGSRGRWVAKGEPRRLRRQ